MIRIVAPCILGVLFALGSPFSAAAEWVPLFDGKTLDGWTILPGGQWTVVDGAIVGTQESDEKRHGMLVMHVMFKEIEIEEITSPVQPLILDKIHDRSRPLPRAVEPPNRAALEPSCQPPAHAVVLFDGDDLDQWQGGAWTVKDGTMESGSGDLMTRRGFSDCRLHVEWRIADPESHGNSGVYLMSQYEVQIYNSHKNRARIYADGMAGAIYGQYPPLVNACRPAGEWEVFDIEFTAPRFDAAGNLSQPATMTVRQNGVVVQDDVALTGPTGHQSRPPYRQLADQMPLTLQYHGDRLQFRNIWLVPR